MRGEVTEMSSSCGFRLCVLAWTLGDVARIPPLQQQESPSFTKTQHVKHNTICISCFIYGYCPLHISLNWLLLLLLLLLLLFLLLKWTPGEVREEA